MLYVAGENADKMIVHAGGWKARLPAISIEPESSLAMAESRYPVTKAGLLELTKLMLHYHTMDLQTANFALADLLKANLLAIDHVPHSRWSIVRKRFSPDYRKTITIIDNEWKVPVCIRTLPGHRMVLPMRRRSMRNLTGSLQLHRDFFWPAVS